MANQFGNERKDKKLSKHNSIDFSVDLDWECLGAGSVPRGENKLYVNFNDDDDEVKFISIVVKNPQTRFMGGVFSRMSASNKNGSPASPHIEVQQEARINRDQLYNPASPTPSSVCVSPLERDPLGGDFKFAPFARSAGSHQSESPHSSPMETDSQNSSRLSDDLNLNLNGNETIPLERSQTQAVTKDAPVPSPSPFVGRPRGLNEKMKPKKSRFRSRSPSPKSVVFDYAHGSTSSLIQNQLPVNQIPLPAEPSLPESNESMDIETGAGTGTGTSTDTSSARASASDYSNPWNNYYTAPPYFPQHTYPYVGIGMDACEQANSRLNYQYYPYPYYHHHHHPYYYNNCGANFNGFYKNMSQNENPCHGNPFSVAPGYPYCNNPYNCQHQGHQAYTFPPPPPPSPFANPPLPPESEQLPPPPPPPPALPPQPASASVVCATSTVPAPAPVFISQIPIQNQEGINSGTGQQQAQIGNHRSFDPRLASKIPAPTAKAVTLAQIREKNRQYFSNKIKITTKAASPTSSTALSGSGSGPEPRVLLKKSIPSSTLVPTITRTLPNVNTVVTTTASVDTKTKQGEIPTPPIAATETPPTLAAVPVPAASTVNDTVPMTNLSSINSVDMQEALPNGTVGDQTKEGPVPVPDGQSSSAPLQPEPKQQEVLQPTLPVAAQPAIIAPQEVADTRVAIPGQIGSAPPEPASAKVVQGTTMTAVQRDSPVKATPKVHGSKQGKNIDNESEDDGEKDKDIDEVDLGNAASCSSFARRRPRIGIERLYDDYFYGFSDDPDPLPITRYKCIVRKCPKFSTKVYMDMVNHIYMHHLRIGNKKERNDIFVAVKCDADNKSKMYSCNFRECDVKKKSEGLIKQHTAVHLEMTQDCPREYCPKKFLYRAQMIRHVQRDHAVKKQKLSDDEKDDEDCQQKKKKKK